MLRQIAPALLALALTPATAEADTRTRTGAPPSIIVAPEALIFISFDADRDLKITFDELQTGADAAWRRIGNGGDVAGYLEVQNWLTELMGSNDFPVAVLTFDPNYDAGITADEFKTELRRRFLQRDANMDKSLTRNEFVEQVERPRVLDRPPMENMPRRRR